MSELRQPSLSVGINRRGSRPGGSVPPVYSRKVLGRPGARPFLWTIWATATLLVLQLVHQNVPRDVLPEWLRGLKLLGVPATAGFLGAALAAFATWLQLVANTDPFLRLRSWRASQPDRFQLGGARAYWHVRIHNIGRGIAQIINVEWVLRRSEDRDASFLTSIEQVRAVLEDAGLRDGFDYALLNMSPGFALAVDEQYVYFEADIEKLAVLARFDVVVDFDSLTGVQYQRVLSLLPHPGSTRALVDVEPDEVVTRGVDR